MTLRTLAVAFLLLFAQHQTLAQESMSNEASIRELLALTETKKMIDGLWAQMDSVMEASMKQALSGQTLTAAQQAILDDMRKQTVAVLNEEFSWAIFEPMMIDVYRKSFTESEVQGMLQFYKSPAGKAVIAKMPTVMQASMQAAQSRMVSLQPKMLKIQQDTRAKLIEASPKSP